jgi:hypothetical protein
MAKKTSVPSADDRPVSEALSFIPWLFLSISLAMLVIAVVSGVLTAQATARQVSAIGNVVEVLVEEDSQGNNFYTLVVVFKLADGSEHMARVYEGGWPPEHPVGAAVRVRYDPAQPGQVHLDAPSGFFENYLLTLITAIIGATFGAGAVFAVWILRGAAQSLTDKPEGQE